MTTAKTGTAQAAPKPQRDRRTKEQLLGLLTSLQEANEELARGIQLKRTELLDANRREAGLKETISDLRSANVELTREIQIKNIQFDAAENRQNRLSIQLRETNNDHAREVRRSAMFTEASSVLVSIAEKKNIRPELTARIVRHLRAGDYKSEEILEVINRIMVGATRLTNEEVVKATAADPLSEDNPLALLDRLMNDLGGKPRHDCAACRERDPRVYDNCILPFKTPFNELRPGRA